MPNHVHNIVSLQCDEKLRMEILAHIQDDEKGPGSIDFNKIIPMPESLDMPSGSMEEHAIDMYLTAVNPTTPDYGLPKLPVHVFIVTAQKMNAQRLFGKHEVSLSDEQMRLSADRFRYLEGCEKLTDEELLQRGLKDGETYVLNTLNYGSSTWYHWCMRNWGTKWNAYECVATDDGLFFDTAWSCPEPVIKALAEKYPNVRILHRWADEDIGHNVGEMVYENGCMAEETFPTPGSREAYELAADISGIDLLEMGYQLTSDGSNYIYADEAG